MHAPTNRPAVAPTDEAPAFVNAKASARARRASRVRHASGRRRRIDPTTCERDYTAAELEFLAAIQEFKRCSGRLFPSWGEVLEVARGLGYVKLAC